MIPHSLLVVMHKEIEEYLEKSGLAWTHLRPTGFMQEYLREAPSIIKEGAFYLALGDVMLNPIDLVDVAKVGFLLLRNGGHEGARLPMTGPEALTMAEIADRISRAIGRTVRYVAVSPIERRQALIAHGIPPEFADALDKQVEERLKGGASCGWTFRPTSYSMSNLQHSWSSRRGMQRHSAGPRQRLEAEALSKVQQTRDTGAGR